MLSAAESFANRVNNIRNIRNITDDYDSLVAMILFLAAENYINNTKMF